MGVVGGDPEFKVLDSGPMSRFSVCVEERWRATNGEKKVMTTWFRCSAFQRPAEQVKKVLKKGSWVFLEGRMRMRKGENNYEHWNVTVDTFRNLSHRPGSREHDPADEDQTNRHDED